MQGKNKSAKIIPERDPAIVKIEAFLNRDMKSFLPMIRSCILAGIFVVIPIFLSVWIALTLFTRLTDWAVSYVQAAPFSGTLSPFWTDILIRIFSLLCLFGALFLIGLLARVTLGRKLIMLMEKLLLKLPIIRFIYSTCKQIGDALWSSKGGNMFHQVVLFEYPRKGCYAIGFLTNENNDDFEVTRRLGKPMISIFMPTTPNPTSGFLILMPREECVFLDMSVAEAMRLIVSCGAVLPELEKNGVPAEEKAGAAEEP